MSSGRAWRAALAAVVSLSFLWLLLRDADVLPALSSITYASPFWLIAGLASLMIGYAGRIRRWQLMLRDENPQIGFLQCGGPLIAGFALNNVLPFRVGDVVRCVGFSRELGVSRVTSTTSLVIERILDTLALLVALGLAIVIFGQSSSRFLTVSGSLLITLGLLSTALLFFPKSVNVLLRGLALLGARALPRWTTVIDQILHRTLSQWNAATQTQALQTLIGWSSFIWMAEGITFYCVARSLLNVEFAAAAWLAFPIATLATLLPGTPGHIGTFDFFAAQALQMGGSSETVSIAFAVLVHATLWIPVTVTGAIWLWMRRT